MPKLSTVNDHRSSVEAAERRLAAAREGLRALQAERAALEEQTADASRRLQVATMNAVENPNRPELVARLRELREALAAAPARLDAMPDLIAAAEAEQAAAEAALASCIQAEAQAAVPALLVQRVRTAERIDALLADLAEAWGDFTGFGAELRRHQATLGADATDVDGLDLCGAVKRASVPLALALGMPKDRAFHMSYADFQREHTDGWSDRPKLATAAAA